MDVDLGTEKPGSDTSDAGIAFAVFACVGSVVSIGLAVGGHDNSTTQVVSLLAPALWVLGTVSLVVGGRAARSVPALLAVACYAAAFAFPAVISHGSSIGGHIAFFAGWCVVPLAWLANPAIVVALMLEARGHAAGAATLASIALLLALTTLGMRWNDSSPGPGFWLWAAAPGLLALACALEASTSDARQPSRT